MSDTSSGNELVRFQCSSRFASLRASTGSSPLSLCNSTPSAPSCPESSCRKPNVELSRLERMRVVAASLTSELHRYCKYASSTSVPTKQVVSAHVSNRSLMRSGIEFARGLNELFRLSSRDYSAPVIVGGEGFRHTPAGKRVVKK